MFATRLENGATKAIRWTKVTTNLELKRIVHAMMDAGVAYEALSNLTSDHSEALAAFQEKRKPKFTGPNSQDPETIVVDKGATVR